MSEDKVNVQERLRLQTLARYFAPVQITADIIRSSHEGLLPPGLSQSTQLTAITQNGVLRLQCDRAFVSLIDASNVYILAEATRSISIRNANKYKAPEDVLFLGTQALDKCYGICPDSMGVFTDTTGDQALQTSAVVANTTRYVIRDLREMDQYKDRPYVAGFPHMRSYAEVPVKSSNGRVLGTYCVIDNKVRDDFFSDDTIDVLDEIAECISEHLELQAAQHDYARGEKLMQGLSEFTRGRTHSDKEENARSNVKTPSSSSHPSIAGSTGYFPDSYNVDQLLSTPTPTEESASESSSKKVPVSGSYDHHTPVTTPSEGHDLGLQSFSSLDLNDHQTRRPDLPKSSVFSRAANLIQTSLDVEGLVFLDASNGTAGRDSSLVCEVLGSALASKECALGPSGSPLLLHETSLGYLAKNYPHGCSISADEYGFLLPNGKKVNNTRSSLHGLSSPEQDMPQELSDLVIKARSLIFLPLWDYSNEKFFAGLVGWSTDPTRVFHEQDLTCLLAFGNALMNEMSRSEAVDIARSKSDFMSSISHELRSPLHGVLASVELLQELVADDSQQDLINMIHSCGTTLLDTLNHLLDFSKINEFTDAKSHVRKLSKVDQNTSDSAFGKPSVQYLCKLVQDVVDGVHFGQTSQQAVLHRTLLLPAKRDHATLIDSADAAGLPSEQPNDVVGVFVNTENRFDWCMSLPAGAYKRIVMNLFANSLKYTRQGQIEVSLNMVTDPQGRVSGGQAAHLIVKDTGIGMSEEFIKKHLYTPFVQENPLANGTGLGLSIVKQIIEDLGGTISVESTPGVGTCFDVLVPIPEYATVSGKTPVFGGELVDSQGNLKGLKLCLLSDAEKEAITASHSARRRTETLQLHIKSIANEWFNMIVTTAQSPQGIEADFFLVEAHHLDIFFPPNSTESTYRDGQRILVVEGLSFTDIKDYRLYGNTTKLTYPVSPKSLGRTLLSSLKNSKQQTQDLVVAQKNDTQKVSNQAAVASSSSTDEVPRVATDVSSTSVNPVKALTTTEPFYKHHLLLVDDNAINLKILSTYAKKLGFTAQTAENGLEAYEHYKATKIPYSMILMDISMPIMNGFEASRAIREYEVNNPDKIPRPTRIVALTGLGSEASKQEAILSGIDDFKVKPVSLKILKDLLGA